MLTSGVGRCFPDEGKRRKMLPKTANGEKEASFKYNGGESTDPSGLKLQLSAGWWKKEGEQSHADRR